MTTLTPLRKEVVGSAAIEVSNRPVLDSGWSILRFTDVQYAARLIITDIETVRGVARRSGGVRITREEGIEMLKCFTRLGDVVADSRAHDLESRSRDISHVLDGKLDLGYDGHELVFRLCL